MIRISYVDERMDDPRKSTMRKLSRFGMAYRIDAKMIRGKVLLWPFSGLVKKENGPASRA